MSHYPVLVLVMEIVWLGARVHVLFRVDDSAQAGLVLLFAVVARLFG